VTAKTESFTRAQLKERDDATKRVFVKKVIKAYREASEEWSAKVSALSQDRRFIIETITKYGETVTEANMFLQVNAGGKTLDDESIRRYAERAIGPPPSIMTLMLEYAGMMEDKASTVF
jgi:hypothetical protein